jgi:hypothetical protein
MKLGGNMKRTITILTLITITLIAVGVALASPTYEPMPYCWFIPVAPAPFENPDILPSRSLFIPGELPPCQRWTPEAEETSTPVPGPTDEPVATDEPSFKPTVTPTIELPPPIPTITATPSATPEDCDDVGDECEGHERIIICHHPTDDPDSWHTLEIPKAALTAHLIKHGDTEGPCNN